jgi:predicted nucleotide-binding protein
MPRENFQVAIMHGGSNAWRSVERWVSEAGFKPRVLKKEHSARVIFERLRNSIWKDIHCVIVIFSEDEEMSEGVFRARQNVVFEMGYCFGAFDSLDDDGVYTAEDAIIFLKESGVELFEVIQGLTYIEYKSNTLARKRNTVKASLEMAYKKAKEFYKGLG